MTVDTELARYLYVERMKAAPQFKRLHAEPLWRPGEQDIAGFIHDEVVRQYHDPAIESDGGVRIRQMRNAWEYAQAVENTLGHFDPTVEDILAIAGCVEPETNSLGFRQCAVYIGDRMGVPYKDVPELVERLVQVLPVAPEMYRVGFDLTTTTVRTQFQNIRTADDWYILFQFIHPFGDGNGRTGKILHNWLLETLDDPVLVADYFGGNNP